MRNFKILMVMAVAFLFSGMINVNAADVTVSNENDLETCLKTDGATCTLAGDISITREYIGANKTVTLDLAGHSITSGLGRAATTGILFVNRGGDLTITDSVGGGLISGGSDFIAGIQMIARQDLDPTDESDDQSIPAKLTVNGGTIEGSDYGITGNGLRNNTEIVINGGTIRATNTNNSAGIFQPQDGSLRIYGGTISGGTGVEVRSGSLTVNGGTITATGTSLTAVSNRNGTSTNGAGIAIVQHVTQQPITANLLGGNVSGINAVYEDNVENNPNYTTDVAATVSGGNYTSTDSSAAATGTVLQISGGSFNTNVSAYLAPGLTQTATGSVETQATLTPSTDPADSTTTTAQDTTIEENPETADGIFTYLSFLLLGTGMAGTAYKKCKN